MGLINSILGEIEVASRPRRKVETESDSGRGTQHTTAMQVPAMKRIVQVTIRRVITQREIVSGTRNLRCSRNREADTRREGRHGKNAHAKVTAIKHQDSVL